MNKLLINIVLASWCLIPYVKAQHIDDATLELDHVTNLFRWSDLIVTVTENTFKRSVTVEEIILNKMPDAILDKMIIVDLATEYNYIQPVLMGGYRYLLFLTVIDAGVKALEAENQIVCKITGGGNGVIALFDLEDLQEHPQVLRIKRIAPKYDPIKTWKNELYKNFGTSDGLKIKEAVERVVALYAEEDPKTQAMQMIESLRDGNPAMIRLSQELLQSIDLDAID